MTVLGLGSLFWSLVLGVAVSALVEREGWRSLRSRNRSGHRGSTRARGRTYAPRVQRRGSERGLGAVLFTDIVGSTAVAAEMGNTRWGELVAVITA